MIHRMVRPKRGVGGKVELASNPQHAGNTPTSLFHNVSLLAIDNMMAFQSHNCQLPPWKMPQWLDLL